MTIRVGRWDCEFCGHKGNSGPETQCHNCGAARPENVTFYLPDDAEIVTNKEEIKKAKSGADWVCSFCGSHNKAYEQVCTSCGNDKNVDDGDKVLKQKEYELDDIPKDADIKTEKKKAKKPSKKTKRIVIGVLLAFFILIFLAFFESDIEVEVIGHQWQRTYKVEYYRQVKEEAWQLPEGAKNVQSFRAIHHYNKVHDGYETKTRKVKKQVGTEKVKTGTRDLGNGHFEDIYEERPVYETVEETYQAEKFRKEPVYQTKYKYKIFRWIKGKPLVARGNTIEAHWPDFNENSPENGRITSKEEQYYLIIKDHKGNEHKEKVAFNFWQESPSGTFLKAKKSSVYNSYIGLEIKNE